MAELGKNVLILTEKDLQRTDLSTNTQLLNSDAINFFSDSNHFVEISFHFISVKKKVKSSLPQCCKTVKHENFQ